MALHERECFRERPDPQPGTFTCSRCQHRDEYQVRWIPRASEERILPGAHERGRPPYGRVPDYLIRVDDLLVGNRYQRKFEITSQPSNVFRLSHG